MAEPAEQFYVFSKDTVLRSIATLEQQQIHEHFSGYLAILRALKIGKGLEPVKVTDIREFHDRYLHVLGAPDRSPFVRPFKSRGKGLALFNPNVSGSYSPASIRAGRPLAEVVEVHGTNRDASYTLKDGHAAAAFKNLLRNRKVPVGALVAFLYRDYGFRLAQPSIEAVADLFREEFGLTGSEGNGTFSALFFTDYGDFTTADLILAEEGNQNA
ncbi:hypothetical protein GOA77_29400 [Sinorhizobium meliloti]|uniref:hypothetical protein n=1 Tax=Rhizobium meliloti TaxID=382 RepID=UPI0001E4B47B|nr:hypothetical protein [Sinorhizobium meliloti]AEG04570.1 hypothetical protein SinmeB_1659 [Sinorhizobium meliloti BL225C]MDE3757888.1 hypothetical protein [Sinorhizobium meliloti]MDE4545516.1 hypothetical protein [Sinorhizobium meliloti]MDE4573460.1 hypothetical protein [Sinorhizobium meliloti]MDW9905914.1 hypothetical protein [Sinorhizobium meliloti]